MRYLKYLKYLLRHKFWVAVYCFKEGLFWQGLVHDNSKLLPSEFLPYVNYFYSSKQGIKRGRDDTGYYKPTDTGDIEFDKAWLYHQNRNKHHWQFWVLQNDDGTSKAFEMPEKYVREMVCDWKGAGKAQNSVDEKGNPKVIQWYEKNGGRMTIHLNSRQLVEDILYRHA
ncbi:MAG: DUF5662 family protein [Nitrospiria bacterium]